MNRLNIQRYVSLLKKDVNKLVKGTMLLTVMILSVPVFSQERVHCFDDTVEVMSLLGEAAETGGTLGDRMVTVAKKLTGLQLKEGLENDSVGTIVVNLHEMGRLQAINNIMAIAAASFKSQPTYSDFKEALEKYSRRKGVDEGFPSQFYYVSDWLADNRYRGNLKDMTEYPGGGSFKTKSFDYMTRNPEKFPAMKDSVVREKVNIIEMGYRSHRIPHLKKQSINNKSMHEMFKNGDIIIMLDPSPDYDLYDIGIIEMKDGLPYLLHFSREENKFGEDPYPLPRLFKLEGQHFYGYQWVQPME